MRRRHSGVRDHNRFAAEVATAGLEEAGQVATPHFLFPLDDKGQVAWQIRARPQIRLDRVEVGHVLAFVVTGPAPEQGPALDARLERCRLPEIERFGGLDVVVAIDQIVRLCASAGAWCAGENDRVSRGRAELRFEPDGLAMPAEPVRARLQIGAVVRLGGDAGEAHVGAELFNEAGFVGHEIVEDGVHSCFTESGEARGRNGLAILCWRCLREGAEGDGIRSWAPACSRCPRRRGSPGVGHSRRRRLGWPGGILPVGPRAG